MSFRNALDEQDAFFWDSWLKSAPTFTLEIMRARAKDAYEKNQKTKKGKFSPKRINITQLFARHLMVGLEWSSGRTNLSRHKLIEEYLSFGGGLHKIIKRYNAKDYFLIDARIANNGSERIWFRKLKHDLAAYLKKTQGWSDFGLQKYLLDEISFYNNKNPLKYQERFRAEHSKNIGPSY